MPVLISFLRGVNVGGRAIIRMDSLRDLYASLGFENPATYVQSGNVVFRSKTRALPKLAERIEEGIEARFGIRPAVILRTLEEMQGIAGRNPFAGREGIEPAKLLVTFLAGTPAREGQEKARQLAAGPEEMHIDGRELFVYFPNGMGKSKLSMASVERALKVAGTGRNWNTVTKLLELGRSIEASS